MRSKPFIDTTGLKVEYVIKFNAEAKKFTQKEIEVFWNRPYELPENEKLMLDLIFKRKAPKDEGEETLLIQLKEIEESGRILDIQGEVF
tara:strand:- start:79 stop:345 length:267 start_codon:yes stop_codon:yes gene_type:complete